MKENIDEKEESWEDLMDDDEISPQEEAFMRGYNGDEGDTECDHCGEVIESHAIFKDLNGEKFKFCSKECATKFEENL